MLLPQWLKKGCMFNLKLSSLHTTRVFVAIVPSEIEKLSRSKTVASVAPTRWNMINIR